MHPVSKCTDLGTATVLLVFARDYRTSQLGKHVLRSVIASCPIAIAVAGVGSEAAFDDLVEVASDCTDSRHIMTAHIDDESLDDIAEGFLFGVMPAEERFEEWEFLAILIVDDASDYHHRMETAISKWADESGDTIRGQQLS
jgi:hypothetical protein